MAQRSAKKSMPERFGGYRPARIETRDVSDADDRRERTKRIVRIVPARPGPALARKSRVTLTRPSSCGAIGGPHVRVGPPACEPPPRQVRGACAVVTRATVVAARSQLGNARITKLATGIQRDSCPDEHLPDIFGHPLETSLGSSRFWHSVAREFRHARRSFTGVAVTGESFFRAAQMFSATKRNNDRY